MVAGTHNAGQAKVGQDHLAVSGEHDIAGLEIVVHHAPGMGIIKGAGQGGMNLGCFCQREGPLAEASFFEFAVEGWSSNQLHDHIIQVTLDVKIDNLDNVGVAQPGNNRRFAFKPKFWEVLLDTSQLVRLAQSMDRGPIN